MTSPTCETIQEEISAALDEGRKLPAATVEHAAQCAECAAFLDLWAGEAAELLARPLPAADLALREKILALPARSVAAAAGESRDGTRRKFRGYFSAAAAAVAIAVCGYSLIDIRKPGAVDATADLPAGKMATARELAALRSDLRKGLSTLRQPVTSVQRVLGR